MNSFDRIYWIESLSNGYGFTYQTAKEITEQQNADYIIRLIITAYNKGKQDGTPNYNYSGGL